MIFPILLGLVAFLFAYIAFNDLRQAIILLLGLLPTYLIRFSIGPFPTTLLEVLLLILILVWVVRFHGIPAATTLHGHWIWAILLLIAAASIGVSVAPDTMAALGIWKAYIIEPILLFLIIRTTIKTKTDIEWVFIALGISAIVVSIFAIIQFLTGIGLPIPWDIERRVTSFYDFPNAVGLFLGPVVTIGLVHLFRPVKEITFSATGQRWFWGLVSALGLVTVILAKTEAALVAIPAAILLVSFLCKSTRKFTIPFAILLAIVAFAITPVKEKLLLEDYSGGIRLSQWRETAELLKDHALFGTGLSGYPTALAPYHQDTWIEIFQYPHNIFLNIWVELGLLGLVAFVLLAITVLRNFLQNRNDPTTIIAFTALLEMLIHGLVDVPYFKNDLAVLTWALLAILSLSSVKIERKNP